MTSDIERTRSQLQLRLERIRASMREAESFLSQHGDDPDLPAADRQELEKLLAIGRWQEAFALRWLTSLAEPTAAN